MKQVMKRDVFILHYIISGRGVFLGEKFDESCGYIVVPNEIEIIESDKENPYESCWIIFGGVSAGEMMKKCGFPNRNGVFKFDKNKQCADILKNAVFEMNPKNSLEEACIMQSAFYRILSFHMQNINERDSVSSLAAIKVREFIKQNYHKKINISQLAQENYYTRNYLYSLFKKEFGISPQEYILELRIEKAKLLLRDTSRDISVAETAFEVGYSDPLYFSRIFHRKTGFSPTEFKKICRENTVSE